MRGWEIQTAAEGSSVWFFYFSKNNLKRLQFDLEFQCNLFCTDTAENAALLLQQLSPENNKDRKGIHFGIPL